MPELVPRELIPDTVSLNAASNNLARAVGPALGGLMVAGFQNVYIGSGSVFALNALSFAGVIWVLVNWKRIPLFKSALPSERIAGSIRSGLRYVRYAPDLQASLVRAFVFTFFISAIWSLLAVVARRDLKQGPLGYGILNGSLGLGAVIAATSLHRIRQRFTADQILATATLYNVYVLLILAFVKNPFVVIASLIFSGAAWTSTMSTINVSVQLAVPAWVQARALGDLHDDISGRHGVGRGAVGLYCRTHLDPDRACLCGRRAADYFSFRATVPHSAWAPCLTIRHTGSSTRRRSLRLILNRLTARFASLWSTAFRPKTTLRSRKQSISFVAFAFAMERCVGASTAMQLILST